MLKRISVAVFLFTFPLIVASTTATAQAPEPMGGMKMDHAMGGQAAKPMGPASPLKISYEGKSAEWTPTALTALPHTSITVFNEHAKANQTYSGVPLIALLGRLGLPEKPHGGADLHLYLVAEGADGYGVVYSYAEIAPSVHDATVLVADTLDGKPLGESGPFQLVATGEKHPGRWVRNLAAIRVMTAQ